ncbi:MAG: tRNA uridine-5-carboxymethylaminomethyl(34) synthesis GTPase MnmE [Alphaproteobacteria bacterium]
MSRRTIFAVASAPGKAAVAVVRVSGPATREVLAALAGRVPPPRQVRLRQIRDPDGESIDRGFVIWFPAPRSFTGEDMAELHVHGGRAVAAGLVAALSGFDDVRPAEAGEFAKRAFLNGKLDLTAAEGVADLVAAETEAQRKQALRQMEGEFGRVVEDWRERLVRALAHVEAEIDFADEDLGKSPSELVKPQILGLRAEITQYLDDDRRGERLREGVSVAIVGPPNSGKSSLLNYLVKREAAIVSALAGTTRDVIEVHLDLGGYPVVLADTAGLRPTADDVEKEGVRRAIARAESADLKLVVVEAPAWPRVDAGTAALIGEDSILVLNKRDLVADGLAVKSDGAGAAGAGRAAAVVETSVRSGEGLDRLLEVLEREVAARLAHGGGAPMITRARHRTALQDCVDALRRFSGAPSMELAAEDLRIAARALGRITGRTGIEDLLDVVFQDFCIGK